MDPLRGGMIAALLGKLLRCTNGYLNIVQCTLHFTRPKCHAHHLCESEFPTNGRSGLLMHAQEFPR